MQNQEEVFYVGLSSPKEVRRNILESTRDIVLLLRSYENLKTIRVEKAELMNSLSRKIKEMHKTIASLKKQLPKTRLREEESNGKVKKSQVRVAQVKQKSTSHDDDELHKLEAELSDIENKLRSLN